MTTEAEAAPEAPEAIDTAAALEAEFSPKPTADASAAPDADAKPEGEQPPAKPKQTAQDRIDELTREKHEARRDADYWKSKATQPEPKAETPPVKTDGPPNPDDFEAGVYDPAYIDAKIEYGITAGLAKTRQQEREESATADADKTFQTRLAAAAEKHADFNEKVIDGAKKGSWDCTPTMLEAVKDSEAGADVMYHLANNPDEARRIAALSPIAQVRELGRIEAGLATPAKPAAKTATDAPEPPPKARGGGGQFETAPDTNDFRAFESLADAKLAKA